MRLRGCRIAPQVGDIGSVRFDEGDRLTMAGVDLLGKLLDRLHWGDTRFAARGRDGWCHHCRQSRDRADDRRTAQDVASGRALLVANDLGNVSASVLLGGISATEHVGGSISARHALPRQRHQFGLSL